MRHTLLKIAAFVTLLPLAATTLMAQDTPLWIGYRLPDNPDLQKAGRAVEASARTEHSANLALCAGRPSISACERQAEITFRGHMLAITGLSFTLYSGVSGQTAWLLNLPSNLALNPDFDQNFSHLDPDRIYRLGLHIDTACQFRKDADNTPIPYSNAMLAETVCSVVQKKLANVRGNVSGELVTRFLMGRGDNQDAGFFAFLVERGADPNSDYCCPGYVDREGIIRTYTETALYMAVDKGYLDLARTLLDHGADIRTAGGPSGATPLMAAAAAGRADLIRLLIDRGADVNAADGDGKTAMQKAEKAGHQPAVDLLRQRGGR